MILIFLLNGMALNLMNKYLNNALQIKVKEQIKVKQHQETKRRRALHKKLKVAFFLGLILSHCHIYGINYMKGNNAKDQF